MAVIKRWWSEKLDQHLYLRAGERGWQLTIAAGELGPVELHFDAEQEARRYAQAWMERHPDGQWRQQPL